MPSAHSWRPRSGSYDLPTAQRTADVDAAHLQMPPPVLVSSLAHGHLTQPRANASAFAPCAPAEESMPGPSGFQAGPWMNPAYLPDEAGLAAEPTAPDHAVGALRDEPGPLAGIPLPARPDSLSRAVNSAWKATGVMQGFYGAEFSHASDCAGSRLGQLRGEDLSQALAANFHTLTVRARIGTIVRVLRDIVSLIASIPLAFGLFQQMAANRPTASTLNFSSFKNADLPFGSPAASLGLTSTEVFKAIATSAFSYQTIAAHHTVDAYLRRTELTLKLADAILNHLGAPGAVGLPSLASTPRSTTMAFCAMTETARHLSTVFTLVNYLIAPVRVGLFVNNEFISQGHAGKSDWMDPLAGLLRCTSSVSDTIRALLSQVGTYSRHKGFALRMAALLDSTGYLSLRIRALQGDPGMRDRVEAALNRLHTLCTLSTNEVLDFLSQNKAALTEALLNASRGGDSSHAQQLLGSNLQTFGIRMGPIYGNGEHRLHLYRRPEQNHWGKVSGEHANWWERAQFPLRLTYRLTLMLQHWLASLAHRLCAPCEPPLQRWMQR